MYAGKTKWPYCCWSMEAQTPSMNHLTVQDPFGDLVFLSSDDNNTNL